MNDVQALVDALAVEVGRPIGVDDRHFRVIAFSPHQEGDRVRLTSILQREAPAEVRAWLESVGVHEATSAMRVPANPELEMSRRVCFPLQFDQIPLGYMWMIDEPEPLTDEQLREIMPYAEELAVALYRARLFERDDRECERKLVGELTGRREGDPAAAAETLVQSNYLARTRVYGVMVLRAMSEIGEVSDPTNLRMVDAAERFRRAIAPRHLLVSVDGSDVIVLLACNAGDELKRRSEALAELAARQLIDDEGCFAMVGVGEEQTDLARLGVAYHQAAVALRVATKVRLRGPVVEWSGLGAYRLLAEMLAEKPPTALLPSSFERLLAASDATVLIETLERYLDLGGDARAAAEALHLHRSSLYGRLRRIEEIAKVDIRSGEDRLELHLALRLWHLGEGRIRR